MKWLFEGILGDKLTRGIYRIERDRGRDRSLTLVGRLQLEQCRRERSSRGEFSSPEKSDVVPSDKFTLLVDLGIITVPDDYNHASRLTTFAAQNREKFTRYDEIISDANFPNPSRILKPGDKLWARVFQVTTSFAFATSAECMSFLASKKAIYTGAQGASLVFEQKRGQLRENTLYLSFDEPDRLYHHDTDYYCLLMVGVNQYSSGDFMFRILNLANDWAGGRSCILCFCDVP